MTLIDTNPILSPISTATDLLDEVLQDLSVGQLADGMRRLFRGLDDLRAAMTPADWRHFAKVVVPAHPLRARIHAEPVTRRSYDKPRGYAGDAELLDSIYGIVQPTAGAPWTRALYEYCAGRAPIRAVRHRREVLSYLIDRVAEETNGSARVLSVACGHLRELDFSASVGAGAVREVVGLDADADSLDVAQAAHPKVVTPKHMSVRRLLGGRVDLGAFDLVYSAGLYDYLEDRVAKRLTASLFDMLKPGGCLQVCNFLATTADVGYMETFMDWDLIYRDRAAIEALLGDIDPEQIESTRYNEDAFGTVGYLEVRRSAR